MWLHGGVNFTVFLEYYSTQDYNNTSVSVSGVTLQIATLAEIHCPRPQGNKWI